MSGNQDNTGSGLGSQPALGGIGAAAFGFGEAASEAIVAGARRVGRIVADWQRERAIEATMKALSDLDDRTLADIGVRRDDVWNVAVRATDAPDAPRFEYWI